MSRAVITMKSTFALVSGFLFALVAPLTAAAQTYPCVPGNPLYENGDYRCFSERPRPTRARASVSARVEAARFVSGGALGETARDAVEDHFHDLAPSLASQLPSLVDGRGGLHTPDVRLSVILLPSGHVGRVRVLSRLGDPLDRQIAQSLALGVSNQEGVSIDGSEVEVIVRLRPQLHYTRWRAPRNPACCFDDDE